MNALTNINGKILAPEHAKVSVFDRGFLFGDGVYETGRSYDRVFLFLKEHLTRLRSSASRLGIPVIWSDEEIVSRLSQTAGQFGKDNVYFRIIITRGEIKKVGLDVMAGDPTLVILVQELSPGLPKLRTEGYSLLTSKVLRNSSLAQDPNIKSSNYLNSLLALKEATDRGAMDAVLLNANGQVTEGTTFSVFSVSLAGVLRTPDLKVGILDSITRRHVLKIAKEFMPVEEGIFDLREFLESKEVFLVSSVREICPVNQWDDRKFLAPGPITLRLQQAYREEIAKSISGQKSY
ncbi:MAG: branched-chain amino acid aminotransferase [Proteobacteria bacterium]|nr:branched-chain amino acid aminotransferase [Pseudomonadota bacterium]NDC25149.1 branched-chain amino acid aminotransferase [Pseudomonadota bacterium]NDD05001.1 branched-chain amino acid aminotransferase [Pseudomonadota bacterium]